MVLERFEIERGMKTIETTVFFGWPEYLQKTLRSKETYYQSDSKGGPPTDTGVENWQKV